MAFRQRSSLLSALFICISGCTVAATPMPPTATPALPTAVAASPTPVLSPTAAPTLAPIVVTPEATVALARAAGLAAYGADLLVNTGAGQVARIDPVTNEVTGLAVVNSAFREGGFAANEEGVWLADFEANLVYRLDPSSLEVIARVPVNDNPLGLGISDGSVWVAQHRGGSVTRIDAITNEVLATIVVTERGSGGPHAIGFGLGSVWVSAGTPPWAPGRLGTVVRIDPLTNSIQATIDIPWSASACGSFAITEQAVWMASCGDQTTLVRIDPVTNEVVATIDLGALGGATLIDGTPWLVTDTVSGPEPGRLVRIDPVTNTIDRVLAIGDSFHGGDLLVTAAAVWVADWRNEQVLRLPLAAFNQ
jgi:streptogramin lyase